MDNDDDNDRFDDERMWKAGDAVLFHLTLFHRGPSHVDKFKQEQTSYFPAMTSSDTLFATVSLVKSDIIAV